MLYDIVKNDGFSKERVIQRSLIYLRQIPADKDKNVFDEEDSQGKVFLVKLTPAIYQKRRGGL